MARRKLMKKTLKRMKADRKFSLEEVENLNTTRMLVLLDLKDMDFQDLRKLGEAVGLPRIATKVHHFSGDVTTSMMLKLYRKMEEGEK